MTGTSALETVQNYHRVASFAAGGQIGLFYYPHTATTTTAAAAECFTVRDSQIVESVLVFDRLSFAPPSGA